MKLAWLCLLLTVAAGPVWAQPSPAEARFAEGEALYKERRFAEAAAKYREAYDLSHVPALLFNVAQAHRLAGSCPEAVAAYEEYLREAPDAPNRADAEARRAELAPTCPPAPVPRPPIKPRLVTPPITATPPATDHPGRTMRWTGLAVGGAGLASFGVATYFGLRSRKYSSDLTDRFAGGGTWDDAARALERKGESAQKKATIFAVTGGALLVGGGVLWFLGFRAERAERIAVTPVDGGAVFGYSGRF